MNKDYHKRGFTLIELLISLALVTVIVSVAFSLYFLTNRTFSFGQTNSELQSKIRIATAYITRELRNSYQLDILASMPATPVPGKRYFYIENNTIKHLQTSVIKDLLPNIPNGFVPSLSFSKNLTNYKILKYTISGIYNSKVFSLSSEVFPLNMADVTSIAGITVGTAIAYSSPLIPSEIVSIDSLLLDLQKSNQFLFFDAINHIFTSRPPPYPNSLFLPSYGPNGSVISWSSDAAVLSNSGVINRPDINMGDKNCNLSATISFTGADSITKEFKLIIQDMDALTIATTSLPPATIGESYMFSLAATGGTGVYVFEPIPNIDNSGLSLDSSGKITGTPNTKLSGDKFSVRFRDNYAGRAYVSQSVNLVIN